MAFSSRKLISFTWEKSAVIVLVLADATLICSISFEGSFIGDVFFSWENAEPFAIKNINKKKIIIDFIPFFFNHNGHKGLHKDHKVPLIIRLTPSLKNNELKLISKPSLQLDSLR